MCHGCHATVDGKLGNDHFNEPKLDASYSSSSSDLRELASIPASQTFSTSRRPEKNRVSLVTTVGGRGGVHAYPNGAPAKGVEETGQAGEAAVPIPCRRAWSETLCHDVGGVLEAIGGTL